VAQPGPQLPPAVGERRVRVGLIAGWDDVRRIALALPETTEVARDRPSWRVRDKPFVWERALRPADLKALGFSVEGLEELIGEVWLDRAPKRLANKYVEESR